MLFDIICCPYKMKQSHWLLCIVKLDKMECQRWPEKPLILGRSGTQYVAMVTKLLSSNCGAHLVESYCKELNISGTNWLRYLYHI